MSDSIQFTQAGYDKLVAELGDLKSTKRKAAVDRLARARSMGDLSENSEYHAAKEELAFVEGRVSEIEQMMRKAEVIASQTEDWVSVGTKVTVEINGKEMAYEIVGEFEADPTKNKLSATSPIGKALIGKEVKDEVKIAVPAGTITYKILKIAKN